MQRVFVSRNAADMFWPAARLCRNEHSLRMSGGRGLVARAAARRVARSAAAVGTRRQGVARRPDDSPRFTRNVCVTMHDRPLCGPAAAGLYGNRSCGVRRDARTRAGWPAEGAVDVVASVWK